MRPIKGTVTDQALAPLIPKPIIDRDPGDEIADSQEPDFRDIAEAFEDILTDEEFAELEEFVRALELVEKLFTPA